MHFTPLAVAALATVAQAVDVQVVSVGKNPTTGQAALKYYPEKIKAAPGSMVQFQFWAGNHTVTQSDFDHPCTPIHSVNSSINGIWSGFMPVAAGESKNQIPVYTVMINDTKPIWIFCSQGPHCEKGMSLVINENTSANATRSLENYQAAAANVAPGSGSSSGSSPSPSSGSGSSPSPSPSPSSAEPPLATASSDPNSGYGSGYGSGSGSGSGSDSGSSTAVEPPAASPTGEAATGTGVLPGSTATGIPVKGGASAVGVSGSLLLALGAAFALL